MISIYMIKPQFQRLLFPVMGMLAKNHITPNQITCAALVLSLLNGLFIILFPHHQWPLILIPITLLTRMALNALDGMLARHYHMQSSLGLFLNELGDVISDSALYLPFALVSGLSAPLIILIVIMSIIAEMTGIIALQIDNTRHYDGPMGKSDRAFIFALLGIYLGLGHLPGLAVNALLIGVLAALGLTIYNRAKNSLKAC